jgi:type IV pilus assembly protein PilE
MKKKSKGFTLMELMVVVGVIGILSAIAIPQYNDYTTRAKIAEATSGLSDGRIKMEQFFQDNRTYVGGPTPASTTFFDFSLTFVAAPTATTYTLAAVGKGGMLGYNYTINEANVKATNALPAAWTPGSGIPATCWVIKKRSC